MFLEHQNGIRVTKGSCDTVDWSNGFYVTSVHVIHHMRYQCSTSHLMTPQSP